MNAQTKLLEEEKLTTPLLQMQLNQLLGINRIALIRQKDAIDLCYMRLWSTKDSLSFPRLS